jgi:hypothetical protein
MIRKLSPKKIRPTKAQLDQFSELKTRLTSAMADIDAELASLLQPRAGIDELANQIRSIKSISRLPSLTMLSRNLVLIFIGTKISSLDSEQVKANKEHTQKRCDTLKSQHPHVTLMWAAALPPSSWKTRTMTDTTFDFLIHELKADRLDGLLPEICQSLRSLAKEEPLNTCDSFEAFASDVLELDTAREIGEAPETMPSRPKRTLATLAWTEASSKKSRTERGFQG